MYNLLVTSWDINMILCLISWGLPHDVVQRMMKMTKKTHEEFSLEEAKSYWIANSPTLVRLQGRDETRQTAGRRARLLGFKFFVPNDKDRGKTRISVCRARNQNMKEFKKEWRLRSIEDRKAKVIQWCKIGAEEDQLRHQYRLLVRNPSESYSNDYTKNLWSSWETWSYCEHQTRALVRPQLQDRRNYISRWYEDIHSGRFFLFYQKNKIIEERFRDVPKGPCEDGYVYPKTPIFDWGPYEQLIEDLRCIDGPGIGETGTKIEHIDDLFI